MTSDDQYFNELLKQLKFGATFIKQKVNGKQLPRRYFLDQQEAFISYDRSGKVLGKPPHCKSVFVQFDGIWTFI